MPLRHKVKRWIAWGPGSSAVLSIACFVVILTAVIGFQRGGQNRTVRQEIAQAAPENARGGTPNVNSTVVSGNPPIVADGSQQANATLTPAAEATLARARACAAAARWDCVLDAASSVIAAQEGNTEAQALLQRAIVQSGWSRENAVAAHASNATAAPPRAATESAWRSAARKHSHTVAQY
jgi:hypothetical protein